MSLLRDGMVTKAAGTSVGLVLYSLVILLGCQDHIENDTFTTTPRLAPILTMKGLRWEIHPVTLSSPYLLLRAEASLIATKTVKIEGVTVRLEVVGTRRMLNPLGDETNQSVVFPPYLVAGATGRFSYQAWYRGYGDTEYYPNINLHYKVVD